MIDISVVSPGKPMMCLTVDCLKTYCTSGNNTYVVYLHRVGWGRKINGWFYMTYLNDIGHIEGFKVAEGGLELLEDNQICDIIAKDNGWIPDPSTS